MEGIREYLLRIVSCSILCGIAVAVTAKLGAAGKIVKLITGVLILITIVSPVLDVQIGNVSDYLGKISMDADTFVAQGENVSAAAMEDIIKAGVQAYILDKADSFGADLQVEVGVTDDPIPQPSTVRISGSISPYGKRQMQNMIREELGIELEDQIWPG